MQATVENVGSPVLSWTTSCPYLHLFISRSYSLYYLLFSFHSLQIIHNGVYAHSFLPFLVFLVSASYTVSSVRTEGLAWLVGSLQSTSQGPGIVPRPSRLKFSTGALYTSFLREAPSFLPVFSRNQRNCL